MPGSYLTKLTPQEETQFMNWVKKNNVPFDPSPNADYDMRGFWKGLVSGDPRAKTSVNKSDGKLHFTDTWKTPYHKTFSNESIYADKNAPHWVEDKLIDNNGKIVVDESLTAQPSLMKGFQKIKTNPLQKSSGNYLQSGRIAPFSARMA